jgi:hypothetical protein
MCVTKSTYSYNKSQQDALFLNFILERTPHVLDRFTVHHQESEYCIHGNWYLSYSYVDCLLVRVQWSFILTSLADSPHDCMTNTSCREYSVHTPDDGQ